jgi:type II secretory pathway pseudopilin PulG
METASPSLRPRASFIKWPGLKTIVKGLLTAFLLVILLGVFLGPVTPSLRKARESAAMQTSRTIALAMFQFANDNGGKYPTGRSSTEVFQQLIDGKYVADPAIFYIDMPGKSRPQTPQLKPENVCYDVTVPVDSNSPDGLPLVFVTGYRVEYKAGGSAIPLAPSPSPFGFDGLAVCYKSNNAWFKREMPVRPDGVIQTFVPAEFAAGGRHFQQLTPDGSLPPAP